MQTYKQKIQLAQDQLNGIEHDPAAKWARTMYAAQTALGWTHEYCSDGMIDFFMTPEGCYFRVERANRYLQEYVYQIVKTEVESIAESLSVLERFK